MMTVSGCFFLDPAPGTQEASVALDVEVDVNGSEFRMTGAVRTVGDLRTDQPGTFDNVTVTLYRADGTPLCTRDVGSLRKDGGRQNLSIRWRTIPRQVIIDADDIWESNHGSATYYNISKGGEFGFGGLAKSRDGFPVDATNKSEATCNKNDDARIQPYLLNRVGR